MTIEWKRVAAAALASAALATAVLPARADVLSEMNRFWQGAAVNTTGPTAFQGQASGHWTLGNLYLRSPVRSEQIATVSLPSFRSGCGGIDAFAGAFSFINSDQLIAFGRAVAQNAAGFAFELALETISPVIAETMAKLRALAQWVNSQNLNSCETAQALGVRGRARDAGVPAPGETGSAAGAERTQTETGQIMMETAREARQTVTRGDAAEGRAGIEAERDKPFRQHAVESLPVVGGRLAEKLFGTARNAAPDGVSGAPETGPRRDDKGGGDLSP